MQHSKEDPKIQNLSKALGAALSEYSGMYGPAEAVELAGQIHTSALADECVPKTERVNRAHFITLSCKVIAAALELHAVAPDLLAGKAE